ncbi:transcriptional coactivator hfi1/ADA1 [Orbilia brochopaga]|uniref:Transcriptional coactivator hfi1/ADA1 n=1 Tax=Orbilia brochopaga TaxID=3140254 RepID=A0AAV9VCU2_9PEZI
MSPDSPIDPSELETTSSSKKAASKSLPNCTASTPTTATGPGSASLKPGVKLPARIDVENIYSSLRESLGDDWGAYSDAVRSFVRGLTNRTEFARVIDPFLQKPEIQRLHNQFFLSVTANATREPPEGDVATWVSHQGKTSSVPKTASGDAYERRLKKEIMAIPARDRRRMKEIPEIPDDIPSTLTRHYTAKQIRNLDTSAPPVSAGLNKNWQNEVLNAYQSSLAVESGEYIDTETIQARCVPICYEEGISSNVSEETARFIGLATDFFVKDVLTTMIDRVRLEEHRRVLKDDDTTAKNRKKAVEKVGGTISMEHLRLSVSLSDNLIRQMPLSVYSILGNLNQYSRTEDDEEEGDEDDTDVLGRGRAGKRIRLDSGPNGTAPDHMDVDGAVPDTVKWENPASVFLMECLSGH